MAVYISRALFNTDDYGLTNDYTAYSHTKMLPLSDHLVHCQGLMFGRCELMKNDQATKSAKDFFAMLYGTLDDRNMRLL